MPRSIGTREVSARHDNRALGALLTTLRAANDATLVLAALLRRVAPAALLRREAPAALLRREALAALLRRDAAVLAIFGRALQLSHNYARVARSLARF
jgi:hypothetical protein